MQTANTYFITVLSVHLLLSACGLALLATSYAGALVVLMLTEIRKYTGLCAGTLKSSESAVQRFILLYADFCHLIFPPSVCGHLFCSVEDIPTQKLLYCCKINLSRYFYWGFTTKFTILPLITITFTTFMPLSAAATVSSAAAAALMASSSASAATATTPLSLPLT